MSEQYYMGSLLLTLKLGFTGELCSSLCAFISPSAAQITGVSNRTRDMKAAFVHVKCSGAWALFAVQYVDLCGCVQHYVGR